MTKQIAQASQIATSFAELGPQIHVRVTQDDLRALRMGWSPLLANKAKELWTKGRGKRIRGQGMIGADAHSVRTGFDALRGTDFRKYNLPQEWVERRQIPRAIDGRVPAHSARVLDLGCGPGTSTEVLCYFAQPSWHITGFDITPHLIEAARSRARGQEFRNKAGAVIAPHFECQDISAPLRERGQPIPSRSVDLAISGGVVGLYMDRESSARLMRELARVLKPGAFACIDSGPAVPKGDLLDAARAAGFAHEATCKSFVIEPRPKLVFRLAGHS